MKVCSVLFVVAVSLLSPDAARAQTTNETLPTRVAAGAGAPVDRFELPSLQRWEVVDDHHVMVWTRVTQAWLLGVDESCHDLKHAQSLTVTSSARQVRRQVDAVLVGDARQPCTINEIRPVESTTKKGHD